MGLLGFELNGVLKNKLECDTYEKAIELLIEYYGSKERSGGRVDDLMPMLQDNKQQYNAQLSQAKKRMPYDSCILNLSDKWYAIECYNSSVMELLVCPLCNKHDAIDRNPRDSKWSKQELEILLPGFIDEDIMQVYDHQVYQGAISVIRTRFNLNLDKGETELKPSSHALKRWVQRVYGISAENLAMDYVRANKDNVENDVMNHYKTSELIWENDESVQYWFDSNNFMYVVANNTIITLYEEDFGFTKDINRTIVLMHVKVLYELKESLSKSVSAYENDIKSMEGEINAIDSELSVLADKVKVLESQKTVVKNQIAHNKVCIQSEQHSFLVQCDKLFKKKEM